VTAEDLDAEMEAYKKKAPKQGKADDAAAAPTATSE
jgi:hypothetical protein